MRKNLTGNGLPEIVFSSSDPVISKQINALVREKQLRKLLPKVYTSNMLESDEAIVKKNLWMLLSSIFPGSILSHRSALEFKISPKGNIYLTGKNRRVYRWPGVNIRVAEGPGPLEDDNPLFENLYASSLERAVLENLGASREVDGEIRILDQNFIEERLMAELNARGEAGLNKLRDRARDIAEGFNWIKPFEKLDQLIGSILSSRPVDILKSPVAMAKALGEPYDAGRMALFQNLVGALKKTSFPERPEKTRTEEPFRLISFFESYFSNYIEGTTFEISEAKDIIFEGKIIPNRTGDTHDVLKTFQVVSDRFEMNKVPNSPEDFVTLLQKRHSVVMSGRPDKNPGEFKTLANRAGETHFVAPEMVKGTLKNGFKMIDSFTNAIQRALFMMFLVSEVHPFDDGNGRIARIMMNAELVQKRQSKLIIPTVYREDYILNLKKLTRKGIADGYIKMMDRAHAFSHWLNPIDFDGLTLQLTQSNAFRESDEAALTF